MKSIKESMGRVTFRVLAFTGYAAALVVVVTNWCAPTAHAQLVLNEYNGVGADSYLQTDLGKLYEGYDYGVIPYSNNTNPVDHPTQPGNPFPVDVDGGTLGNQTTLPNGWVGTTGWGRIKGNGGDWMELVVTEDHTDIRGWTLFFENDEDVPLNLISGERPDERGFIKFTQHPVYADLRAGTIVTISENSGVFEIRDQYPIDLPGDGGGAPGHDTGFVYDLYTNTSFDPFAGSDWHMHLHVDEAFTDLGLPTPYFEGYSDAKADNDDWRVTVFDSTNNTIVAQAEQPGVMTDLMTGRRHGPLGEGDLDYTGSGVNNQENFANRGIPGSATVSNDFEDVDYSSFGMPNVFNNLTEATPDGVQDFSGMRNPVLNNTFDVNVAGTSNFNAAGSWKLADTGSTPGTGPQAAWSTRITNPTPANATTQVTANATIAFATVQGVNNATSTLEVRPGATLTVAGGTQPGRVLVHEDGVLRVDGNLTANTVEVFTEGTVQGAGTIQGTLRNPVGNVAPGNSAGKLTVQGNYTQGAAGTLTLELGGATAARVAGTDYDQLKVTGTATLAGALKITKLPSLVDLGSTIPITLANRGKSATFTLLDTDGSIVGDFATKTFDGNALSAETGKGIFFSTNLVGNDLRFTIFNAKMGDADGDSIVSATDVFTALSNLGPVAVGTGFMSGNFDLDGAVSASDVFSALSNLGAYSPMPTSGVASSVPEPCSGTLVMLVFGLAIPCLRRRCH